MTPVGFEPTIPAGERPKTYALDRAATGTGISVFLGNLTSTRYMAFRPIYNELIPETLVLKLYFQKSH